MPALSCCQTWRCVLPFLNALVIVKSIKQSFPFILRSNSCVLAVRPFPLPFFVLVLAYLMKCDTQISGDAIIPLYFANLIVFSWCTADLCLFLIIFAFLFQSTWCLLPEVSWTTTGALENVLLVELGAERIIEKRAVQAFATPFLDTRIVAVGFFLPDFGVAFLCLFGDGDPRVLSSSTSSVCSGNSVELATAFLPRT